jgi:peptidase M15-like protein
MPSRLEKLNERIGKKLDELAEDRQEVEQARKVVHRKDVKVEDLKAELHKVRKRLKRRRDVIKELKGDLDEAAKETPDEDTEQEQRLRARLDRLAGEYEEQVAVRDRLLDKLDQLRETRADAREALSQALAENEEDREAIARMRARRKRIQERKDKPSPNFDFAEFDCNDGTPLPLESEPAVRDWCRTIGEPVRAKFGSVHINSGFRHAAYNARIGGEDNSVHIYDYPGRDFKAVAGDFTCGIGTPAEWYAFTLNLADGRGRYATFHHADTRNNIGWSDASWSG